MFWFALPCSIARLLRRELGVAQALEGEAAHKIFRARRAPGESVKSGGQRQIPCDEH